MQTRDMAEKVRVLIDGEELPGLVNFGERTLEKAQIDVPEFKRIRRIQNGVATVPVIELTYKVARDSETRQFLNDWFFRDEVHEVTVIRTDAAGVEFERELMPDCECVRHMKPAYDAAAPTYAQIGITIAPWDIIPLRAAG